MGSGAQKGPGETDEALAGEVTLPRTVAGGNGDEIGVEAMLHNIAGVKFVRIAFPGKDDGGFEGFCDAGDAVCGEMQVGIFAGVAGEIDGGPGIFLERYSRALFVEMALDSV